MAAGFLPPALTEVTAALFTYILLHVRIRIFFSPRRAPTAPAVECLAAAGLAPALSPPRGRD